MSNELIRLQEWYASQCNSDWEHAYGCRISSLDNPGWYIEIDVEGTSMESCHFQKINTTDQDENDWMLCKVEEGTFKGASGPLNLVEIIRVFLDWVDSIEP